jgi:dienelactone hydrolase
MQIHKNFLLNRSAGKPIAADIFYKTVGAAKPVVIYAHGFNGFKDWGNFDIIAKQFAEAGFVFIKFNFSHNGTTPDQPEDFADLDAYGENNYTKELHDLQQVINWSIDSSNLHAKQIDATKLYLIGHSRGGGIVLLKAAEEPNVKAVCTWASVSECKTPWGNWNKEKMLQWKETGVQYYLNSRTRQQMPLYYQLYEDYQNNSDQLNIKKAISSLQIPVLICHGTKDEAVPVDKAYELEEANPGAELFLVDSDHVFGRRHPWTDESLPAPMQQVVDRMIDFFREAFDTLQNG